MSRNSEGLRAELHSFVSIEPRSGFWGRWLDLTSPPRTEHSTFSPMRREEMHKAELIGYFLFIMACFSVFDLILGIAHPASLLLVAVFIIFLVIIALLNRSGLTSIAASLLVGATLLGIMGAIVLVLGLKSAGELFPVYDLLVYPLAIGSLFLPRRLIFPFAGCAILFIVLDILFLPHSHDVEMFKRDSLFLVILRPTTLVGVVSLINWLGWGYIERAILQVDKAEELLLAQQKISDQTEQMYQQKVQLESEITQILGAHREAASGNYTIRVPVYTQDLTWQIGRSLNNLLARYERLAHDSKELELTNREIEQIAKAIEANRRGQHVPLPPVCNSPLGKRLIYAFGSMPRRMDAPEGSSPSALSSTASGPLPGDAGSFTHTLSASPDSSGTNEPLNRSRRFRSF